MPMRFCFRRGMRCHAKRMLARNHLKRAGLFNVDYATKLSGYDKTQIKGSREELELWMLIAFMLWHEPTVKSVGRGGSAKRRQPRELGSFRGSMGLENRSDLGAAL